MDAHVFDDSYQGTTTYLKGLYTALVEDDDFEITLGVHNLERIKTIFPDPRFRFIQLPTTFKIKRLVYDIPSIIKENKCDFAHFQYITPLKKECLYINTVHDLLFMDYPEYFPFKYRFRNKHSFKISARKADVICTISEFSKDALIRHFKLNPGQITITPNAVNNNLTKAIDVKDKFGLEKYILFVSRLEPRKNHYLTIKCFVELELYKQGYKMVFVGRTKDVKTENYESYYKNLPNEVKSSVIHFENLPDEELNGLYAHAALFIYPSLAEGFGIPPLEAAINNCKVLCSNSTAMKDFSFFGNYLFDPHNEDELKSKIRSTLADNNYPFREIREAILKKYNWDSISKTFAARLKAVYTNSAG